MPELPEVETIRRNLADHALGARVMQIRVSGKTLRQGRVVPVAALREACRGRVISGVRRLGKYLLVDIEEAQVIVVHLGMSGKLQLVPGIQVLAPHTHAVLIFDDGRELRYVDPRRFGMIQVTERERELELRELRDLGPDPLGPGFSAPGLQELAARTERDIKTFLLDQRNVAGLGNIYVCEALFAARVHPLVAAKAVRGSKWADLTGSITKVLMTGLANGGTTLRDYANALGTSGRNQQALRVYGREGMACTRGGHDLVRRLVTHGRSTFFCPTCQKV